MIEGKVDADTFETEMARKISNREIEELLPDMNMYEQKFSTKIEEGNESIIERLEDKFMA